MKHRFSGIYKRTEPIALVVSHALFVDAPLHVSQHLRDEGRGVFQADGEVSFLGFCGKEVDVVGCIGLSKAKPVVVVETVDVVGIHAIAAFRDGEIETGKHDVADVLRFGVEPPLAWPAV